jgi:quercetin dioxygenase-like cupin family protein
MNIHRADASRTVHGLPGTVHFTVGDQTIRLTPGVLASVAAGMLPSAESTEESALLLTMGSTAPQAHADLGHHG